MTINDILAIVQSDEAREIEDAVMYAILMASVAIPAAMFAYKKFKRIGLSFVAIAAGFLYSMATKPPSEHPQITWDTGLTDAGSTFNTNTWKTIHFRWNKGSQVIGTDAVYFAAKHRDYPELEWSEIGQSTAGQLSWDYTFTGTENATNYLYYAFMLGEVHTNSVWLGTVLQKATPGNCGPDKMVIIKGKLDVNGKVIAPFKE